MIHANDPDIAQVKFDRYASRKKTLFNMSPHYNSKCELLYWNGDEEYPHAGYVIYWQGLQSHTVTSRESVWNVGSFYRLSIPEIFF